MMVGAPLAKVKAKVCKVENGPSELEELS